MAITVYEGWKGRTVNRGSNESIERLYTITGTTDDADAEAALLAGSPDTYRDLLRTTYQVKEDIPEVWRGTVTYTPLNLLQKEPEELGSSEGEVSYATGSSTARRLHTLETVASYADNTGAWFPTDPPDFKGLIGVNKDQVEGVEVGVPAPTYRETHVLIPSSVTTAYQRTVARMAYTVNNATFKGYAAGEVLFVGAEFHYRDSERLIATYEFAISENETGITVGDITDIEKDGHDYLWVLYGDEKDATAEFIVKRPTAVYIERVYKRTDFADLQIGTT